MSVAERLTGSDERSELVGVVAFDAAFREDATAWLRPCCASRRWAVELALGRPYGSLRSMLVASDDIIGDLTGSDLSEALSPQTGRAPERLAALRRRLGGGAREAEREQVRAELQTIVRLRLIATFR